MLYVKACNLQKVGGGRRDQGLILFKQMGGSLTSKPVTSLSDALVMLKRLASV